MGGNTTSHVANATSETIYGKCQDNPAKVDFDVGIEVDTPKGGGGFNIGVEDKTPHIPAGFVALASRDFIGFPSTHPYLSIKTKSGKIICENYHPGQDMSVIVTPDLTLQRAKYGSIWVGNDGERY